VTAVKVAERPADEDFARRIDPHRRELLSHCYRMLGSVHDAEDLVQETFLRAWRSRAEFDETRASLRTWLYRIATNACLTALEHRGRRPLPSGLGAPSSDPDGPMTTGNEVSWLEPFPDALLAPGAGDPAAIVASRGSIRLAFIAALQHLPARQRAVLILRDVLAWRAAEVAGLLDTTTAAVNSALQRARAQLLEAAPAQDQVAEPSDSGQRELLDRYVAAFVSCDITSLERQLADEVVLEMPPFLAWYHGRAAVTAFIGSKAVPGRWRTVLTRANGQLAFAAYRRGDDGVHHAHSVQVLSVTCAGVTRIVAFVQPSLFAAFGLPPVYEPSAAGG
jgi:RNA polymerase sigma-70 factor, ECF subfamily